MLRLTTIALAATAALADPLHAIIETDKGTIKVELLLEHFPISVSNFVDLAESGWYDGQHISRVKEGEYAYFVQSGPSIEPYPRGVELDSRHAHNLGVFLQDVRRDLRVGE